MRHTPVLVCGAGATKDCGGPLTNEILPEAFNVANFLEQQASLKLLREFLDDNFLKPRMNQEDYPALPLLLGLLDTAIDRKEPLGLNWSSHRLVEARESLEATIFAVLDFKEPVQETNAYYDLLTRAYPLGGSEPTALSLNYDIILDVAMFQLSHDRNTGMPSYICDIKTSAYCSGQPHWGRLLKLHGSVNWLYCPGCHRLDIGWSRKQQATRGVGQVLFGEPLLNEQFTRTTRKQCRDCGAERRHILITPTYRKDYRNPHVARVWYEAERVLQEANRVIFVGYSLPEDDVEVVYLLKRSLADLDPSVITVVEKDQQGRELKTHPVGRRYRALFGDAVDFRTEGFSEWIQGHQQHNWSPLNPGLPRPV